MSSTADEECGYDGFVAGNTYLIYASGEQGALSTYLCSGTKVTSEASEELRYLREVRYKPERGSIEGIAVSQLFGYESSHPLAGIRVTARGASTGQAKTNGKGRFRITDLKPGRYELTATFPSALRLDPNTEPVHVRAHACVSAGLVGVNNATITGSLKPATGVKLVKGVRIVADNVDRNGINFIADTDEQGHYRIEGIRPGSYYIGVNVRSGPQDFNPYPQSIYPDASNLAHAKPVTVNGPGEISGIDIPFAGELAKVPITVSIKSEDVPPGTAIAVYAGVVSGGQYYEPVKSHLGSTATLRLFPGYEYLIRAWTGDLPSPICGQIETDVLNQSREFTLEISKIACRESANSAARKRLTSEGKTWSEQPVKVRWDDGTPIENAVVSAEWPVTQWTDAQGHAHLPLTSGQRHSVYASLSGKDCRSSAVVVDKPRTTIVFELPAADPKCH